MSLNNFSTWNISTQTHHEISKRAVEVHIPLSETQNHNLGNLSSIFLSILEALKKRVLFEMLLRRWV